jgi:hypothetical protein
MTVSRITGFIAIASLSACADVAPSPKAHRLTAEPAAAEFPVTFPRNSQRLTPADAQRLTAFLRGLPRWTSR